MLNFCLKKVNDWLKRLPGCGSIRLFSSMLLGQDCHVCRRQSDDDILCAGCRADLGKATIDPTTTCPQCAMSSPQGKRCGACLGDSLAFDRTVACFTYQFPVDRLIGGYKFRGKVGLARWFADRLLETVVKNRAERGDVSVDLLLAVPLHDNRIVERGYNQAWEVTRLLAKNLGCETVPDGLIRVRDITPQHELPKAARRENPKGAFICRTAVAGKRIAVVDDVMTTGATLAEIASVLRKAGAISVVNWVIARTP